MNTILETNAAIESVRQVYDLKSDGDGTSGHPRPEWVRGTCPQCGDKLVANAYYVGGRGYIVCWECWSSLGENPSCQYRRII